MATSGSCIDTKPAQEDRVVMRKRLALVGGFLAVAGMGFGVAAAVAYDKVQDGYDSLQAISEA